ncbi:MAG TPA: amidohydrolase family protein [Allosphingosinicella sp.]|nr:amidohydrolase family protein [Allosphingosinicella sp.]
MFTRLLRATALALCLAAAQFSSAQTASAPGSARRPGSVDLAITNVTVVDPQTRQRLAGRSVFIDGDRIVAVRPATGSSRYAAQRVVDGTGQFLVPGLMDMHAHLFLPEDPKTSLNLLLANGVTSIREMSGDCWAVAGAKEGCIDEYRKLQRAIRAGAIPGPDLVRLAGTMVMGPAQGPLPKGVPPMLTPGTPEQGRQLVRHLKGRGIDIIKTHDTIPAAVFAAMMDEARRRGIEVSGHVPFGAGSLGAAKLGYGTIEHARDLLYDCSRYGQEFRRASGDFADKRPGSARPSNVVRLSRTVDEFDSALCAGFLSRLARTSTYYTPTHVTREMEARAADPAYRADPNRRYIAPARARSWEADLTATAALPQEERRELDRFFRHGLRITGLAHRAGVPIMAGTDLNDTMIVPGFSLHRELRLLVEAGLSPMDAMRAATAVPAAYLGRGDRLGGVAAGKEADLVLLGADPTADIGNISSVRAVIANGRLFNRAALDGLLSGAERIAAEPVIPQLTAEQWREDLRFMATEMEQRHKNLYHSVSREAFKAAVDDLYARIPTLQRNQIIVGMMRIAAMVGDGHTRVDPRKDDKFGFPSLPLKLYLFEDGLYVRAARPEYRALLGARVEAIGGVPVVEAMRRAAELASRDNEIGPKLYIPIYLAMPDILHALELSDTRNAAKLTLSRGGRRWTALVPAGAIDPKWPPDTDISLVAPEGWVDARTTPQPPMWLQAPLDYHRLIELPERRAIYAQINMVADIKDQSLAQFGRRIRERAEATNPRAVIVDLRLNLGGNGYLRNGLVRELIKTEDSDTRLFVLTWRGTFSASQFILDDLDRLSDAVVIGEPASSKPSSYGDAYRTLLPHSGIQVRSSIYYWQQGQNDDPWTWVDLATPYSFADYAAGRDPPLEAALTYAPAPPLRDRLLAAAQTAGMDGLRRAVAAYRDDPANRYSRTATHLLVAAEHMNQAKKGAEAIVVAQAVAEQEPRSVDAANVLAHLAFWNGRKELARQWVLHVLELDPDHRVARTLLERLGRPD